VQIPPSSSYHLLSALLVYLPASALVDEERVLHLLRMVPLACGVAQVDLAYRAVRYAFPGRADLQRLGTTLGGLLPMNLYMSQYVGNEPLTGCLTAAAIVVLLRWHRVPEDALVPRSQWLLGVLLGLAILTKPTAVLVVAPGLLVLASASGRAGKGCTRLLAPGARVFGAIAVVAGWYYVRNWVLLGRPFVGGWDRSRGFGWWQEPGYRVPEHFTSFGEALVRPVYGGVSGLWDAEYATFWADGWLSGVMSYDHRPPWNYALMLPAPWLALVPAAAIGLGVVTALRHPDAATRRSVVLSTGLVALYLGATVSLYLQVPIYSAAKATQLLGLTPCFAVLGAAGFGILGRARALRPLLYGAMACWAVFAYLAYFTS
jgi:4-amino-4-deoxy-L-arabinose transferase-like glycosyltransferase